MTPRESTSDEVEVLAPETQTNSASVSVLRMVLLGVLTAALLVAAGILIFLLAGRRGDAAGLQQERDAAATQARQFMLRINTYGPDLLDGSSGQMPDYRSGVEKLLTAKFKTSFDSSVPIAENMAQQGVGRTSVVYATGISTIDSDSATALVAGSFSQSYPGKTPSAPRVTTDLSLFRAQVSLNKVNGAWLIDSFTPVVDPQGSGQPQPGLATPPPATALPTDQPGQATPSGGAPSGGAPSGGAPSGNGSGRSGAAQNSPPPSARPTGGGG